MRKFLAVLAAFMLGSTPTYSEDDLEALETVDQGRAYQAIGRLDIAGSGFCTGTLISLDLVLTAAHCVYDSETKERIPASEISFKPGLRNGRAAAYRSVRRVAVHPDYDYDGTVALDSCGVLGDCRHSIPQHPLPCLIPKPRANASLPF